MCKAKVSGHKTYYISSSAGDDENDGLCPETPFRSLRRASELLLQPGESLLFKSGDVWTGESLYPKGSGTEKLPITVSSYGEGKRPRIAPGIGKKIYGIRIVNADGYRVTNIEICDCYGGLVVWTENTYRHRYLWVENCFFHDITGKDTDFCCSVRKSMPPDLLYGTGVSICGSDAYGGRNLFSDITITDCNFDRCDVGIEVIGRDHDETGRWIEHGHSKITAEAFKNVNIRRCNVYRSYRTGGVMLYCITGGVSEEVLVDQTGYRGVGMWWGVAAFQVARVSDYLIRNCTFSNTVKGESPDGQGFDFEADNHNVTVRNCKFLYNEGPAVLFYGDSWPGENDGNVVEDCLMEGNNPSRYYGNVVIAVGKPMNRGIIRNCEIHLLNDSQDYSCGPIVFAASNRVYDTSGKLVCGKDPGGTA